MEERRIQSNIFSGIERVARQRLPITYKGEEVAKALPGIEEPITPIVAEGWTVEPAIDLTSTFLPSKPPPIKIKTQLESPASIEDDIVEEKEERPKLPVGIIRAQWIKKDKVFSIAVLNEDEIEEIIKERADKIAKGEKRILSDCRRMVESLREEPYGKETKKLAGTVLKINRKDFPLRSFNPRKRAGFHFEHPMAGAISGMALRVVYAIWEQNDHKVLVLEGIYTHSEYDKKFTLARVRIG